MNVNRKTLLPIKQISNLGGVKGVVKLTADSQGVTLLITFTSVKINVDDFIITVCDGVNFEKILFKNGESNKLSGGFDLDKINGVIFKRNGYNYAEVGYFSNRLYSANETLNLVKTHYDLLTLDIEKNEGCDNKLEGEYDDEAISSYNYYENALPNKTDGFNGQNCNETQEKSAKYTRDEYEVDANKIENDNVFSSVKRREKLEKFLTDYPYYKPLSELLPNAKFSTVNYDSKNEYYVGITTIVGVSYACVAVKGYYGKKPLNDSFFIPLSQLNYEGEGYFVSFSNLETGETAENLLQLF